MPDYKVFGFFTATKTGKTGLTVTVDVRNPAGALVVNNQAATEIGGGVYSYTHTTATEADYLAVFKTADTTVDAQHVPALAAVEIPRLDAAVSSRSSHSAADVWAVTTRTLTSFGSLVADIWSYVTRTITGGGGSAADVWSYNTRTLTMTAAQALAALTGSTLTITNRVTFSQEISNLTIPATWSKIYLTFKKSRDYPDAAAALQWVVSSPAAASTDGIAVYAGNPGGTSRTLGALTVDQPGGKITIGLQDDIDLALLAGDYEYDIKSLQADGSSVILTEAQGVIKLAVTRAV
jgi:hypothetical protein